MLNLESIVVGGVEFGPDEEFFRFRFRLLQVSLATGLILCAALILADWLGLNDLGRFQLVAIEFEFLIILALVVCLWGRRERFAMVAWSFFSAWFLVDLSALYFVTNDEFRPIWFFLQIAVVYAVLGTLPGAVISVVTLVAIVVANRYLPVPFSNNAMFTMVLTLCGAGVFLYFYSQRFIAFQQRVTEANAMLREMSSHDPLTGVLNARAFYEVSDHLIREALRAGTPFSVLFIDLDHFKSINDCYGHDAGDMVLKDVAACLAGHTRKSDALGRIGGEEFLMLLPNTDLSGAKLLAEKLRQNVEALMPSLELTRVPVTVSVGVAGNQAGHETIADIKRQADLAMYRAKATGRNRVVAFEDLDPGSVQHL